MKIRIAALREGINRWQESLDPADLELAPGTFRRPVIVDYLVDRRLGRIEVGLTSWTEGEFLCDRCGTEFQRQVGGDMEVMFIQRDSPLPDEMPGDEMRSYSPGQEEIDVAVEIRDALLLSVPMKLLCREGCRGLCPVCGGNLNNDGCVCRR